MFNIENNKIKAQPEGLKQPLPSQVNIKKKDKQFYF